MPGLRNGSVPVARGCGDDRLIHAGSLVVDGDFGLRNHSTVESATRPVKPCVVCAGAQVPSAKQTITVKKKTKVIALRVLALLQAKNCSLHFHLLQMLNSNHQNGAECFSVRVHTALHNVSVQDCSRSRESHLNAMRFHLPNRARGCFGASQTGILKSPKDPSVKSADAQVNLQSWLLLGLRWPLAPTGPARRGADSRLLYWTAANAGFCPTPNAVSIHAVKWQLIATW